MNRPTQNTKRSLKRTGGRKGLVNLLLLPLLSACGGGGALPLTTETVVQTLQSDAAGMVAFEDAQTGEAVGVLIRNETQEPLENVVLSVVDGNSFYYYVAEDPSGQYGPTAKFVARQSQLAQAGTSITMYLGDVPGFDEIKDERDRVALDEFEEYVIANAVSHDLRSKEQLEKEADLYIFVFSLIPFSSTIYKFLSNALSALELLAEPYQADYYDVYTLVPSNLITTKIRYMIPRPLVKLTALDGAALAGLNGSFSISGDTAIVGDMWGDDDGTYSGAAYVFVRNGTTWTQQQKLTASDASAGDQFGRGVSISGDTAIVGAYNDDDNGPDSGSAYVFVRNGTTWTQRQKLTASDGAAGDYFGRSVSISGDSVIVGAERHDTGAAYVFARNGTIWAQQQRVTASDGRSFDEFGYSVAIWGGTAIVGAPSDDPSGEYSGSAYAFVRNGTSWTQQQKLVASDGAALNNLGVSVSLSGDTAIVGTWTGDNGSAYVFARDGTTWMQQQKITASDGAVADRFGWSVSISGDMAIVGAQEDDDNGTDSGAAYVFVRAGTIWLQEHKLTAPDGAAGDHFGAGVSISGDYVLIGSFFGPTYVR